MQIAPQPQPQQQQPTTPVTVEKTGKSVKTVIAVGGFFFIVGLIGTVLHIFGGAYGGGMIIFLAMTIIGAVIHIIGKVGKWWKHE